MAANGHVNQTDSSHSGSVEKKLSPNDRKQIENLAQRIPKLLDIFNLHYIIGEGSYGSVFLASLKCDSHVSDDEKKFFAIKHLIPISHPDRIEHELRCLRTIGGCDNVVGIDLCIRQNDAVVFIMPYLSHFKFSEYYQLMDPCEIKFYLKNLLLALQRVHQFNVIHRDVKPSNFLYDRINRRYLLVDFGLAQKVYYRPPPSKSKIQSNSLPISEFNLNNKNIVKKRKYEDACNDIKNPMKSKYNKILDNDSIHNKNKPVTQNVMRKLNLSMPKNNSRPTFPSIPVRTSADGNRVCYCFGLPSVCNICLTKQPYKASRSGTPGYRPPEVLLKYPEQTTAVDIWATGVIFLSLLSACYPFFSATDDLTALAEQVSIFGNLRFKNVACILKRNFICNHAKKPVNLKKLCAYLRFRNLKFNRNKFSKNKNEFISRQSECSKSNGCELEYHYLDDQNIDNQLKYNKNRNDGDTCDDCALSSKACVCLNDYCNSNLNNNHEVESWAGFPSAAFDLLEKLLDINPHTRITASKALNHPYFSDL